MFVPGVPVISLKVSQVYVSVSIRKSLDLTKVSYGLNQMPSGSARPCVLVLWLWRELSLNGRHFLFSLTHLSSSTAAHCSSSLKTIRRAPRSPGQLRGYTHSLHGIPHTESYMQYCNCSPPPIPLLNTSVFPRMVQIAQSSDLWCTLYTHRAETTAAATGLLFSTCDKQRCRGRTGDSDVETSKHKGIAAPTEMV